MREILTDLVKQTAGLFETVKVTGTKTETKIAAMDKDKNLFLQAILLQAEPEMEGEFGMSNFGTLGGCLNFASYKTDNSKLNVVREVKNGQSTVTAFKFLDASNHGTIYRTMDPNLCGQQATIKDVPWQLTFTPSKSKIAEFIDLSRLYAEVDNKTFNVLTVDGDLVFSFGDPNSGIHSADMLFESGVKGELKTMLSFDTNQFIAMMKLAGNNPIKLSITDKRVLGVEITTKMAVYNYFLRGKQR